jgi:hypothetical protein
VVYDGGVLSAEGGAVLAVADEELAGFAFVPEDEVLARRIAACLAAVDAGTVAALKNGSPAA